MGKQSAFCGWQSMQNARVINNNLQNKLYTSFPDSRKTESYDVSTETLLGRLSIKDGFQNIPKGRKCKVFPY